MTDENENAPVVPAVAGNEKSQTAPKCTETADDDMDADKLPHLWKAVHGIGVVFLIQWMSSFIVGFLLAYSLNNIFNGAPNATSSRSQSLYGLCVSLREIVMTLISEFNTRSGGWWGRKAILRWPTGGFICCAGLSLIAHISNRAFLHVIAAAFFAFASGYRNNVAGYVADVSTQIEGAHKRNMSIIYAYTGASIACAMAAYLVGFVFAYSFSFGLLVVSFICREKFLPDWSPPLSKRIKTSTSKKCIESLPCVAWSAVRVQNPFMKALIFSQFFQHASFGAQLVWWFNYISEKFNMKDTEVAVYVLVMAVALPLVAAIFLRLFPIKVNIWGFSWIIPLYTLCASFPIFGDRTMWAVVPLAFLKAVPLAAVQAYSFGQLPDSRRHEAASANNMSERCGRVVGALSSMFYSPRWLDNYQNGNASMPSPPMLSCIFDICQMIIIYVAGIVFIRYDKYGSYFIPVEKGEEASEKQLGDTKDDGVPSGQPAAQPDTKGGTEESNGANGASAEPVTEHV